MPPESDLIRVITAPRPFSLEAHSIEVPHGLTVQEILDLAGLPAWASYWVFIDDWMVPVDAYARLRPRPGHVVTVRVTPMGQNGDSGKVLRSLIVLAATIGGAALGQVYLGPLLAGTAFAGSGAAIGATVGGLVGGLLANAIAPPPRPKSPQTDGSTAVFSITGARNTAALYGPIPRVYGRHRIFPPYAAEPFTEIVGNDQYLRLLFCLGYGPLDYDSFKIGDTPIEQFQGVEIESRQGYPTDAPITLYTNDVHEEPLSVLLTNATPVSRTTQADADEFSVDLTFPAGLTSVNTKGERGAHGVQVQIDYRAVGAAAWTPWINEVITDATTSQLRKGYRLAVPRGQYEIQMLRSPEVVDLNISESVFWTALRTIKYTAPIRRTGLGLVAMRIKASDQLNGIVDQFNLVVGSRLLDWNGAAWVEANTANPASIYRDILQGTANARPVADARLDLAGLQAWHEANTAAGYRFNAPIDARTTVFQLLHDVAALGRASFGFKDGTYSVVRDIVQTVPIQHFTPRNSSGFRGSKAFPDRPHGLKVRFIDEVSWQQVERIVYDDGYSEANATKFEQLDLLGVTNAELAYKHGRYFLAVARLRPETYEIDTDLEFLVCQRGDLVKVTHDVPSFGNADIGYARVKTVAVDGGGNATGVTIDDQVTMQSGLSYGARFRRSDGASVMSQVTTVAGTTSTLTFSSVISAATKPAIGDLMMFGLFQSESVDLLVHQILPHRDLTATLVLVDAAPAVHTADTGVIPPFDPHISLPAPDQRRQPTPPLIDSLRSDESVLIRGADGTLQSRILVALRPAFGSGPPPEFLQAEFKRTESVTWTRLPVAPASAAEISVMPVDDGATYDIRIRAVAANIASDWTTVSGHTVVGKSTPPADILTFLSEDRILKWAYPNPPIDFAGFKLRRHFGSRTVWDDAQPVHQGILSDNVYPLDIAMPGEMTYLVKAVDVAGNESLNPAVLLTNIGDYIPANLLLTTDYKANGFPGTIVNGTTTSTGPSADLKATDDGALFWNSNPSSPFWGGSTELFWNINYREMQYLFSLLPDADKVPATLTLDMTITARGADLDYRLAGSALFWNPVSTSLFWSTDPASPFWNVLTGAEWLPWPGRVDRATRQVYEFRVTTRPGPVQGVISEAKAVLDVPDILERLEDIAVSSGGTRLPVTLTYRAIENVSLTLQSTGGAAAYAQIADKASTGPLIKVFNSTGGQVSGLVDSIVQGY